MLNTLRFLVIFALMCGIALGLIQGLEVEKCTFAVGTLSAHLSPTGSAQQWDAWPWLDCSGSSYGLRLTRDVAQIFCLALTAIRLARLGPFWHAF
jgi:hypothetical protein